MATDNIPIGNLTSAPMESAITTNLQIARDSKNAILAYNRILSLRNGLDKINKEIAGLITEKENYFKDLENYTVFSTLFNNSNNAVFSASDFATTVSKAIFDMKNFSESSLVPWDTKFASILSDSEDAIYEVKNKLDEFDRGIEAKTVRASRYTQDLKKLSDSYKGTINKINENKTSYDVLVAAIFELDSIIKIYNVVVGLYTKKFDLDVNQNSKGNQVNNQDSDSSNYTTSINNLNDKCFEFNSYYGYSGTPIPSDALTKITTFTVAFNKTFPKKYADVVIDTQVALTKFNRDATAEYDMLSNSRSILNKAFKDLLKINESGGSSKVDRLAKDFNALKLLPSYENTVDITPLEIVAKEKETAAAATKKAVDDFMNVVNNGISLTQKPSILVREWVANMLYTNVFKAAPRTNKKEDIEKSCRERVRRKYSKDPLLPFEDEVEDSDSPGKFIKKTDSIEIPPGSGIFKLKNNVENNKKFKDLPPLPQYSL